MRDITDIFDDFIGICQDYCDNECIGVEIEMDTDFCYYPTDKSVSISLLAPTRIDKYFMQNAFNKGLSYDCGDFMMSFFHEIGHHYTLPTLSLRQHKLRVKRKRGLCGRNAYSKKANFKYFDLLDEKLATEWAIKYINSNRNKIDSFASRLRPLLEEIKNYMD